MRGGMREILDYELTKFAFSSGNAKRLLQIGIRTLNQHQRQQAERFGVEMIYMSQLPAYERLAVRGPVYISFDMDVLDPATVLMAKSYPKSKFFGFDYHDKSIETAKRRAEEAGVGDRIQFSVAKAKHYPGKNYDLVTFFDCLHDMGDAVGAAAHVRATLKNNGTWMIVEPSAGDKIERGGMEASQRDKVSLDIFWLKDESLGDSANLPDPDVIAAGIAEDLQAALDPIHTDCGRLEEISGEREQIRLIYETFIREAMRRNWFCREYGKLRAYLIGKRIAVRKRAAMGEVPCHR